MQYFTGKTVLITGGGSGIGLAAAHRLRGYGAKLVLVGRSKDKLAAAKDELGTDLSSDQVHTLALDVGQQEAVFSAMEQLIAERPVDMLINNAGVTLPGHFLELPLGEFEEQMRVNYLGSVYMTRALLPGMLERREGHVAFVSSLLGLMGMFGYSAYAPTKFAMTGFAECLRNEYKHRGIRVSCCYPPDTDTPQHEFEKPHLPEETRAAAGNAACIPADQVAERLLLGMKRGCFDILPDGSSKFAAVMNRLLPGLVRGTFDKAVLKVQRRR